jgi:hypothetical protein
LKIVVEEREPVAKPARDTRPKRETVKSESAGEAA